MQTYRPKAGSTPVGMAVLPEGSTAADAADGPWLLLVTANVRRIGLMRPSVPSIHASELHSCLARQRAHWVFLLAGSGETRGTG